MPGLVRVILLALLIWLIIRLYQRFKALGQQRRSASKKQSARPIENMVRCEQCGTHVPEKEALEQDGHYYCSRAHLPRHR
ncbi:PP0621 family protein [Thiohalophilus sp.]|uniref:PP0621 family protein n=1 Tax=Thiohalophilus sp. TaxID=3028392 RepID=UPI003974AA45